MGNNDLQLPSRPRWRHRHVHTSHKKQTSQGIMVIATITLFISSVLLLHVQLSVMQARNPVLVTHDYRSYAAAGMRTLQGMYDVTTGQWTNALWWQQANALETTIDYLSLTHTTAFYGDIASTFKAHQKSSFVDNYYDDEGWWAIAWLKAYDLTHNRAYLDSAKSLFRDMAGGWDSTCDGGIWWSKDKIYKNAIANELFLAVAVRLHLHIPGDTIGGSGGPQHTSYIDWAGKEWQWFKHSGLLNRSNLVNDGLSSPTCQNNRVVPWTYNQGVILGALIDLYHVTHNSSYLTQAEAIADANNRTNVDENGVLYESGCEPDDSCGNDGPQFKGVYMKNLYALYQTDHKLAYRDFIMKNADAIWSYSRDTSYHLGLHWDGPFDQAHVHNQIPAMDALNAAISFSNLQITVHDGKLRQKETAREIADVGVKAL